MPLIRSYRPRHCRAAVAGPVGPGLRSHRQTGRLSCGADLRLVILAVLAEQPGDERGVQRALAARGLCGAAADAAAVSASLGLLADMGLIARRPQPAGQAVYTIVDAGAAALVSSRAVVDALLAAPGGCRGPGPRMAFRHGRNRRRHKAAISVARVTSQGDHP